MMERDVRAKNFVLFTRINYKALILFSQIAFINNLSYNKYMKFILLILLTPLLALADCEQLYTDRLDLAEDQFADMDIADEYTLAKKHKLVQHPYIYKNFSKIIPNMRFSDERKDNQRIRKDLIEKIKNKNLKVLAITSLPYQNREAYLIKEKYLVDKYYSLIFYVDLNCNPFSKKISSLKSPENEEAKATLSTELAPKKNIVKPKIKRRIKPPKFKKN